MAEDEARRGGCRRRSARSRRPRRRPGAARPRARAGLAARDLPRPRGLPRSARIEAPVSSRGRRGAASAAAPGRPRRTGCSAPARSIADRHEVADRGRRARRPGPAADRASCRRAGPGWRPGFSIRTSTTRPTVAAVEGLALALRAGPEARRAARPSRPRAPASALLRRRRAGPRAVLEREGAREADLGDEPQRVLELGLGLAREADDEVRRERDVGPRPRGCASIRRR